MSLEEIFECWSRDSRIDVSELGTESIRIPQLHNTWYRRLVAERVEMKRLESEQKSLRHRKMVFLTQGHDEETRAAGWILPPRGKILKTEVSGYLDSDRELLEMGKRVAIQGEKVAAIEDILKMIHHRSYQISNSIKWLEFTSGK